MPINNKRKGLIEVWQRIMKITVAAMSVRRRQCAADATLTMQHAAARDIMRMKITASRSDELVRLVRQKDQVPMQSADKLRDRATQQTAADVICASVGAAGRRNKKRRHPIRPFFTMPFTDRCFMCRRHICLFGKITEYD